MHPSVRRRIDTLREQANIDAVRVLSERADGSVLALVVPTDEHATPFALLIDPRAVGPVAVT